MIGVTRAERRPEDWSEPPRDMTPVRVRILRGCLVRLSDGQAAVPVEAGSVVTVPRWVADELVFWSGKAEP
ncbi:MAG: hypothetical protein AB1482_03835 [Pseudomonadota bacterium]